MSELLLTCTLPIDPAAAADPAHLGYVFELAANAMDKELAKANRVITGETVQSWTVTRYVDGKLTEFPWAPGEPVEGAVFVYLTTRANTVPA